MDGQIGRDDLYFAVVRINSKRFYYAVGEKALWNKVGFEGRAIHLRYQFCCLLLSVWIFKKDEKVEHYKRTTGIVRNLKS